MDPGRTTAATVAASRGRAARRCANLVALPLGIALALPAFAGGDAARGAKVFAMAAGCGCHTSAGGPVGAGGGKIETPFGTFYGTNITPDPETGIGAWTDEEIEAAIRDGYAKGKGAEAPVMPYNWYAGMSDRDVADLIAHLRTLEPVKRENTPHEGELPLRRLAYEGWRFLFFDAPDATPAEAPASGVERGRYLADHVALCADCHTPCTALGAVDTTRYMGGTAEGPGGAVVPNITPHADGVGDWDEFDLAAVLESGMMPDFDNVQGSMAEAVDGVGGGPGYKDADDADRKAIATYLKTVPPLGGDPGADR